MRHFLPEIYGKNCTIYTDHLPLQMAFQSNNIPLNDPQTYRQITEIGRFTRDVRHVSGIDNVFADYLSRIPESAIGTAYLNDPDEEVEVAASETLKMQPVSVSLLRDLQGSCPEIKRIQAGDKPKKTSFQFHEFDGVKLFCEVSSESGPRPYVPLGMREQIIHDLHSLDHLGVKTTTKRIGEQYYWPPMKHDIKKYVNCCVPCEKVKPNKRLVNTGSFSVPDRRFSHLMVDIVGPLPPSYGYRFLLTIICRTSRFLHAIPLKEASSSEAATAFLTHWASFFGLPALVTSDNGGAFVAGLWKGMMSKLNIDVKYSALYRPESIGMLERQHRGLKDSLKSALIQMGDTHQSGWLDHLPFVLLGRRVAHQPDLGASASEMTFGKNVVIPGQILKSPDEGDHSLPELLNQVRTNTNNKPVQPSRHNPPEKKLEDIPENITHAYTKQHQKTGLQPSFEGPFRIDGRVSKSVLRLEVGCYKDGSKRFELRHLNDLKLAHPDSMAAPAVRPKLGRPSTSAKLPSSTDGTSDPTPTSRQNPSDQFPFLPKQTNPPAPPVDTLPSGRENSNGLNDTHTGPPAIQAFRNSRPQRSSRNPNPKYVDAVWSATESEIAAINLAITSGRKP